MLTNVLQELMTAVLMPCATTTRDPTNALVNLDIMEMDESVKVSEFYTFYKFASFYSYIK